MGILQEQLHNPLPRHRLIAILVRTRAVRFHTLAFCLLIAALESGCSATYSGFMKGPLRRLERRDYNGALEKLQKPMTDTDLLLYRMERGLILHYQGNYAASDRQFDKAERLIDKHYTRSVMREVAAFFSNDAVRAYSGEEYERTLIHYYRTLNSWNLGDYENALVECRKANLRLEKFAREAEHKLTYKNDAFLQYLTGLLYEGEGDWNDAYISYRDAVKGYDAYRETFGMSMPSLVQDDIIDLARALGYDEDVEAYEKRFRAEPTDSESKSGVDVVVLAESGFIARKRQREISLPILNDDDPGHVWVVSERALHRYHYPRHYHNVDYWLRIALPEYVPMKSQVAGVRISVGDVTVEGILVDDLDAIAIASFREKERSVMLRTAARALVKYATTQKLEEESSFLSTLFNLFSSSFEAADTRGWLSLPKSIWMVRMRLPPGTVDLDLEFVNTRGATVDSHRFASLELAGQRPILLSYRSFR